MQHNFIRRHGAIFAPILFIVLCVIAFILFIISYNGQYTYKEKPYKAPIDRFNSVGLVKNVCTTQETVSFILEGYKLNLPCQAREHFSFSRVENQPVDYENPDYKSGLSPVPIRALHFYLDRYKLYNWEVPRPAGTQLSIYISPDNKVSHNCKYREPKQIWCDHSLIANGTNLRLKLIFNAGPLHYGLITGEILPKKYPWAYYPEDKWPELHEQTQKFVKSILE